MATASELLDEEGTAFIPRAPPPSPELPHASFEPQFDFTTILGSLGDSEPTSPTAQYLPPSIFTLPSPQQGSDVEKMLCHHSTSPPHDIPLAINGFSRHVDVSSYMSSSVPVNSTNDCRIPLSQCHDAAQLLFAERSSPENHVRQRKISLKRNHDDLSDDQCYSSSCDPSWLLVETPSDVGHKKACQGRDTIHSPHMSPTRHRKSGRLTGRLEHSPPLVSGIDQLSINASVPPQQTYGFAASSSWQGNNSDDQQMDCSDVATTSQADSIAMELSTDHNQISLTTPSPPLFLPTTRSHTFSFSPSDNSSSLLKPQPVFPHANQTQAPTNHQFFLSFHEQSAHLHPDNPINLLSRSL